MLPVETPVNNNLDEFITVYNELFERFEHDENARALFNDVAVELLTTLRRKGRSISLAATRRYFLWILARKGFRYTDAFWRDVDLTRHQCNYQNVVCLGFDDMDVSSDARFSVDPRRDIHANILLDQAINLLEGEERRLFHRRVVEGHTLQEIADQSNITPQGVKKRLDKIYTQVRRHLTEEIR